MSTAPATLDALPPARPRRRHVVAAGILLAGIGALLLAGRDRDPVATPPLAVNALVHWQDDSHDWLLVADRTAHELVVYDAATGEPLQRLGRDDGLGGVSAVGGHQPAAWKTRSGRLWFTTTGGFVAVDPAPLDLALPPVRVHLDRPVVDGQSLRDGQEVSCRGRRDPEPRDRPARP